MKFIESFAISIRSLLANKLRSSLTMLGIIIGVGAVISLTSIGSGAQAQISSTFQSLGTNVLYVMPSSSEVAGFAGLSPQFSTPSLTLDDANALERIPGVVTISASSENFITATASGQSKTAALEGATPTYQLLNSYSMAIGQFISDNNVLARDTVAVIGSGVADSLFGTSDPLGQYIKIKSQRFKVIGVMQPKGGAIFGVSFDDVVIVPITTFQTRLFTQRTANGQDAVQQIAVKTSSAEEMDAVKQDITLLLRQRHHIAADAKSDFSVVSQAQILGAFDQVTGIFTIVLGAIAGISLLVGGIGIMNIMLVSVTERTREIGVRKAVGAKRRDILLQFLIEAAVLSFTGGAIGILGGWLLSLLISRIDFSGTTIPAVVTPGTVILAASVSVFIGIASGIYPAMRASRLNPIDALHYG